MAIHLGPSSNDGNGCWNLLDILPASTGYTLCCWVRNIEYNPTANWHSMTHCRSDETEAGYYGNSGGAYHWGLWGQFEVSHPSLGPTMGTWYHITITHDGTTARMYVDGTEVLSHDSNLFNGGPRGAGIGNYYGNENDTHFQYLKFWKAALTAAEIQIEAKRGLPVRTQDLLAFAPLVGNGGGTGWDFQGSTYEWVDAHATGLVVPYGSPALACEGAANRTLYTDFVLTPEGGQ